MGSMSRKTQVGKQARLKRQQARKAVLKAQLEATLPLTVKPRYIPKFITNRFGKRVKNPLYGRNLTI